MDVFALREAKHQFVHIKAREKRLAPKRRKRPEPLGLRKHLGFFLPVQVRASGEKGVKSPLKLDPGRLAPRATRKTRPKWAVSTSTTMLDSLQGRA